MDPHHQMHISFIRTGLVEEKERGSLRGLLKKMLNCHIEEINLKFLSRLTQSAWAIQYADCISEERLRPYR